MVILDELLELINMIRICPTSFFVTFCFLFINNIWRVRPSSPINSVLFDVIELFLVDVVESALMGFERVVLLFFVSDEREWVFSHAIHQMLALIKELIGLLKLRRVWWWSLLTFEMTLNSNLLWINRQGVVCHQVSLLWTHNNCFSFAWTHWLFSHILDEEEASLSQKLLYFIIVQILLIELNASQIVLIFSFASRCVSMLGSRFSIWIVNWLNHFSYHFSICF